MNYNYFRSKLSKLAPVTLVKRMVWKLFKPNIRLSNIYCELEKIICVLKKLKNQFLKVINLKK